MRIPCPICGERALEEFTYRGDARPRRPAPETEELEPWYAYVYLRENPMGRMKELWQHLNGCRAWIVVERNTRTHEIFGSELARDSAEGGQA